MPSLVARSCPRSTLTLTATILCGACASGQELQVKAVSTVVQPPANVAIYLKVTPPEGKHIKLSVADFKVLEDGKPLKKVRRALLPPSYAIDRYLSIVVDMSGPLADSEYRSVLEDYISNLAERVGRQAKVSVSVFDGEGLLPFVEFDDGTAKPGLVAMRKFRPRSRNTDLWGMFIAAVDQLDNAMKKSAEPHREAMLVFVTDRGDKVGRRSRDDAAARARKSRADVYVLGVGDGIKREDLEPLGKTAALFAAEERDLSKRLAELGASIDAKLGQDYVFSYCTPQRIGKRATTHEVEIRVATSEWRGSAETKFSTRRLDTSPCDPESKPDFKAAADTQSEAEADPEGADSTEMDGADEEKPREKSKKAKVKKKVKPAADPISETADESPGLANADSQESRGKQEPRPKKTKPVDDNQDEGTDR